MDTKFTNDVTKAKAIIIGTNIVLINKNEIDVRTTPAPSAGPVNMITIDDNGEMCFELPKWNNVFPMPPLNGDTTVMHTYAPAKTSTAIEELGNISSITDETDDDDVVDNVDDDVDDGDYADDDDDDDYGIDFDDDEMDFDDDDVDGEYELKEEYLLKYEKPSVPESDVAEHSHKNLPQEIKGAKAIYIKVRDIIQAFITEYENDYEITNHSNDLFDSECGYFGVCRNNKISHASYHFRLLIDNDARFDEIHLCFESLKRNAVYKAAKQHIGEGSAFVCRMAFSTTSNYAKLTAPGDITNWEIHNSEIRQLLKDIKDAFVAGEGEIENDTQPLWANTSYKMHV